MKRKIIISLTTLFVFIITSFAQVKDKGIFVEPKEGFYQEMLKEIEDFKSPKKEIKKTFNLDYLGYKLPKSLD